MPRIRAIYNTETMNVTFQKQQFALKVGLKINLDVLFIEVGKNLTKFYNNKKLFIEIRQIP